MESVPELYQGPKPSYKILDNLLLELDTLARIEKGEKMTIVDGLLKVDTSIFGPLSRKYFGDDRQKTLNAITKTMYSMLEYIILQVESKFLDKNYKFNDDRKKELIIEFLKIQTERLEIIGKCIYTIWGAKNGILNLLDTYDGDINFRSAIDTIDYDIKKNIENICGKLYQDFGNIVLFEKNGDKIKIFKFMENFKR